MMRAIPLLLLLFLSACSTSQARDSISPGPRNGGSPEAAAESLEQMLARDNFDLPRALLLFGREHESEFFGQGTELPDIEAWTSRFERYTYELKRELLRDTSPRQRMLTLIEFVHGKLGLRFDADDPYGHSAENLFFDRVINRKRGYCVTLSLAYIVFGQAAGLNVAGVRIPGHFAVMFVDGQGPEKVQALIESTASGAQLDELEVWSKHRFSVQSVENGCYLTPLTDKQIMGVLYNNLAGLGHIAGNSNLALRRYNYALELMPNNPEALYNRALIQRGLEMPQPALKDLNEAIRLDPNFTLAFVARAGLLFEAGETESGKRDLAVALRQRPEWPQPHMLDGTLAAKEGRFEDALAAFERALERDPGNKDAHAALAQVLRKLGQEEKAREHERKAR
jgi:regulator of sirC expression with transglutaminase-like and TPR domain